MGLSFLKVLLICILSFFIGGERPVFRGNGETLNQFLESHMIYPSFAKQNCIQGIVKVSFQLHANGDLFNAKIQKGLGVDLDNEAIRLIKFTSHKWNLPKNHQENTEIIIPIKFSLKNYNCETRSQQSIEEAVSLYQTRQALEEVVTSYYKNKAEGKANAKNEPEMIRLKADLGFDEELIAEKLSDAKRMLKQGDKEGACEMLSFIKNIGFHNADSLIAENCK